MSLAAALWAMCTPGCLVTTTPEYQLPDPTPPFLIAAAAEPDVRSILEVGLTSNEPPIDFKVPVLSEDGGESVKGILYVDYGKKTFDLPYADDARRAEIAPGTLADGPRPFRVTWQTDTTLLDPGCHRITLMVTHQLDFNTGCPMDLADSSQITWYVNKCVPGEGCNLGALDKCPEIDAACPAVVGADGGTTPGGGS